MTNRFQDTLFWICLSLLVHAIPVHSATNQEEFIRAYFLIQEGERSLKLNDIPVVQARISEAQQILKAISSRDPEYDPKLVTYYLQRCREMLLETPFDSLTNSGEKLVPVLPRLREQEDSFPEVKPEPKPVPVKKNDNEIEKKLFKVEREIERYRENFLQQLQAVLDENRSLKRRSEEAEKNLKNVRSQLSSLADQHQIDEPLALKLQSDLNEMEAGLGRMAMIASQQRSALKGENDLLRARELQTQTELSKIQALLDVQNQERESVQNLDATSLQPSLEQLARENRVLREILASIEDQIGNTQKRINPMLGKSQTDGTPSFPPVIGRVALVRPEDDFLIVHFHGKIPVRAELGVYRKDQWVGTIRITQSVNPPFATATILSGHPQLNDLIR